MLECCVYADVRDGVDGGDDGDGFEGEEESALPAFVVGQFAIQVSRKAAERDNPEDVLGGDGDQARDAFEVFVRNRDGDFREHEDDGESGEDGGNGGKHELGGA